MDNQINAPQKVALQEDDGLMNRSDDALSDRESKASDVQSLLYHSVLLCEIPRDEAIELVKKLYSPEERFAEGFYRFWRDVQDMPHEEAWGHTLNELDYYTQYLIENLDDPHWHTIGFIQDGEYKPVGIYGFRELIEHHRGPKLLEVLDERTKREYYSGKLAMAHSFCALSGYRNRLMMKYAFVLMAREAVEKEFSHIFFFMSDHRLGPIYKRFGLEFPPNLRFPDSNHLVGSYTPRNHMDEINRVSIQFGFPPYEV